MCISSYMLCFLPIPAPPKTPTLEQQNTLGKGFDTFFW